MFRSLVGNSNSAWRDKTVEEFSVIRVENGNASSFSSDQPTVNSDSVKYWTHGQELNPLIAMSGSESVGDLEKDEFRSSRDYIAYDFNDTRQMGENREHEQNSNSYSNRNPSASRLSEVLDNPLTRSEVLDNPVARWRVSTSPDDRLSLPSIKSVVGQNNSTSAFNSFHIAGSHFKVYSGEYVSSNSRSEILTEVSDGQGDFLSSRKTVVGGVWTNHAPVLTRTARTSTDNNETDSMGVLSFCFAAEPIARYSSTHDIELGRRNGGSSEIDRYVCLISDQCGAITKSTSNSIYQWIISNNSYQIGPSGYGEFHSPPRYAIQYAAQSSGCTSPRIISLLDVE